MVRYAVSVKGIVQGVGFRPFVFRLAHSLSLSGFVRNDAAGVSVEIEGTLANCQSFIAKLQQDPPPLASIESVTAEEIPLLGDSDFTIRSSQAGERDTLVSPDIGICDDCAADILDPNNRRYRYAFTNCTNCGPRFTIVQDIPYDRKNTTMASFELCPDCRHEYENPYDRRFHAQPNACPVCGPKLSFYRQGAVERQDPYELFRQCIARGEIVALKGIGGYHLVCDASNEAAVGRLRSRKLRYDKPFAVMMRDRATVERYCQLSDQEWAVLSSPEKPIVLLQKRADCDIAESVAPRSNRLGVMLPYTPLHCILMQDQSALVMTSGNLSDRPMIFRDEEVLQALPQIADAILTHDRRIHRRVDDSVCLVLDGKMHLVRRARGYVPKPLRLSGNTGVILALGAQQKNTFCLAKREDAFLSGHIGDLDDAETEACLESEIESFIRLFDAAPQAVACDLHPDYVSTRLAARYAGTLPVYAIQHHHAHFASVLAEHRLEGNDVFGLIFDGTGYGLDGQIWGGEALLGGIGESRRVGHLLTFPLLGGEAAIREPWRAALAVTDLACGREVASSLFPAYQDVAKILLRAGDEQLNAPLTSSMGRLFDAVAALAGVRTETSYEGQAAVELQQLIDPEALGSYHFQLGSEPDQLIFDWRPVIRAAVRDAQANVPAGTISARFHRAVSELITDAAVFAQRWTGSRQVVLSGGVFQNDYLLDQASAALAGKGFQVFSNLAVPTNDGGISFGQAATVAYKMR